MKTRNLRIFYSLIVITTISAACSQGVQENQSNTPTTEKIETSTPTSKPTSTSTPTNTPLPVFESITSQNPDGTGSVTDIDGNQYQIVKIGNQWWMAESLRVSRNPNGDLVEGYCFLDRENMCETYGRLYNWYAAMDGSNEEKTQGICPDGWHVPSDGDWMELFDLFGGIDIAGGALKEEGTAHWNAPNLGATNSSGFTGLPAGSYFNGIFEGLGVGVHFWSSTEHDGGDASLPTLHKDETSVTLLVESKNSYISVRCLKNAEGPP